MHLTELISSVITGFIDSTGYITVFLGMAMESMFLPVPSEAIMPFAGFLVAEGRFSYAGVILVATAGSISGSLISYWIGYRLGRPFVDRFGRYVLVSHEKLAVTEHYFRKHGEITVFVCRFIPVVRHLISIPAGMGEMSLLRFSIFTVMGAALWNGFLTWVGCTFRQNWGAVMRYTKVFDIIIVIGLVVLVALYIVSQYRKIQKARADSAS